MAADPRRPSHVAAAAYRPEQITEGAFGLIRGFETTRIQIWFDPTVARYVQRRIWHRTQNFRKVDRGIEMTMDLRGTVEVVSWGLGFGDKATVIEPEAVRAAGAGELTRAARQLSSSG